MSPLERVRAAGIATLLLAALGLGLLALFGVGGVHSAPGSGANPFSERSAVEVGLYAFGAPLVAAVTTLVLARRLDAHERPRARVWRIAAWVVVALPLVPPLVFMAAMSTM